MVDHSFTATLVCQCSLGQVLPEVCDSVKKMWPKTVGWIGEAGVKDLDFFDGQIPEETKLLRATEATFFRDPEMFEKWDWGVFESENFDGEGPLSICLNPLTASNLDVDTTVKHDHLDAEAKDYSLRFIGCLYSLEVILPDDPAEHPFSAKLLEMVSSIVLNSSLREDDY